MNTQKRKLVTNGTTNGDLQPLQWLEHIRSTICVAATNPGGLPEEWQMQNSCQTALKCAHHPSTASSTLRWQDAAVHACLLQVPQALNANFQGMLSAVPS
jgi:hypothetical protein